MSASHPRRSTRLGLVLLAAALGLTLVTFVFSDLWATLLGIFSISGRTAEPFHTLWIPVSGILVDAAIAVLGALGFLFLWRGRSEIGGTYRDRLGLAMLFVFVAAIALVLFALTGILLGYVAGFAFLAPWHGVLGVVGGIALGVGLYLTLANLPLAGARPVAAVALALGVAGIVLLNLASLGVRRDRIAGVDGAGFGLALASVILWLVLCLWGAENVRGRRSEAAATASSNA